MNRSLKNQIIGRVCYQFSDTIASFAANLSQPVPNHAVLIRISILRGKIINELAWNFGEYDDHESEE